MWITRRNSLLVNLESTHDELNHDCWVIITLSILKNLICQWVEFENLQETGFPIRKSPPGSRQISSWRDEVLKSVVAQYNASQLITQPLVGRTGMDSDLVNFVHFGFGIELQQQWGLYHGDYWIMMIRRQNFSIWCFFSFNTTPGQFGASLKTKAILSPDLLVSYQPAKSPETVLNRTVG